MKIFDSILYGQVALFFPPIFSTLSLALEKFTYFLIPGQVNFNGF